MTPTTSDQDLIALIDGVGARLADPERQRQSERALRDLYDRTSSRLFGLALRVTGNRDFAEDVLQEAFITVWRSAGDYRASLSPPLAWLGMIVRSRALDFLRRRTSERADVHQTLDDAVTETVAGDAADPMDAAEASEQAWALHECLRKMEGRQREVVALAYLRDLSHSELAQQLKLPLGTVKTWIRRGLDQLRGCMANFA
ncbi:sigma-70 family RNA polymerase sigma factor [Ramlibacter sp. XY19]|uniref:RNA polymerase sigma factor n=1 Tax=Ramlibacter paludis TaxID=2908000 RepID=UPI0023DCE88B|nr:sigma-70 family RNA polymerase sigma factor [Ramlibacter paludis]MCG2594254.1 sigma-70 family RNA polymerase sigma factor [Ramlibacter paludis]